MIEIVKTHKATKKEILDFIQSLPKEEQRAAYRAAAIMGNLQTSQKNWRYTAGTYLHNTATARATVKNAVLSKMEVAL